MSCNIHFIIFLLISTTSARGEEDLTLDSNPGLHAFSYYGAFADDISFGKLIVSINTMQIMTCLLYTSPSPRD